MKHKLFFVLCSLGFGIQANESKYFDDTKNKKVVLIPSYNNEEWVEKNLSSLLAQKDDNWVGIYINDFSLDKTREKTVEVLKKYDNSHRIFLQNNATHRGNCANLWLTIHECNDLPFQIDDMDPIIIFDGDDWYMTDEALPMLHQIFSKSPIRMTYGGYREFPGGEEFTLNIPSFIVRDNSYRSFSRHTSQQRSFYAWMYRLIKLEDFFFEGRFLPAANDLATSFPLFEIAGGLHRCLAGTDLYAYNRATALNDDKLFSQLQQRIDKSLRQRKKYNKIDQPILKKFSIDKSVDFILLLDTVSLQALNTYLNNVATKLFNLGKIYICCNSINKEQENELKKLNPHFVIHFCQGNIAECFYSMVKNASSNSVVINTSLELPKKQYDLRTVSKMLNKTHAFCCDLLLDKNPSIYEYLAFDMAAWQNMVDQELVKKNALKLQVFLKDELLSIITKFKCDSLFELKKMWIEDEAINNCYKVNLFFLTTDAINFLIPEFPNIVREPNILHGGVAGLHRAAQKGDLEAVRQLILLGAEINILDEHGSTPLMYASSFGNASVVEYLLSIGADKYIKNYSNASALDYAKAGLKGVRKPQEIDGFQKVIILL